MKRTITFSGDRRRRRGAAFPQTGGDIVPTLFNDDKVLHRRRPHASFPLGTSFLSLILLLAAATAHALTVTVDTTDDDPALSACYDATPNDCSLRGAIAAANADAEHYDIRVPSGTYLLSTPDLCGFSSIFGGEWA